MAGQNTVEHKLRLLIETELDDDSKLKVGKQLKSVLGAAAISFDEAETKKNVVPIIRMLQKLFDKAEMKFNVDELLGMPSQQALQKIANITADDFQTAFDRALAKSGGIKIDFGNVDLSGMTEPLERVTEELAEINRKIANETKKSVDDINLALNKLDKKGIAKRTKTITEDGAKKKITNEVVVLEEQVAKIEETLNKINNQKTITSEKSAVSALEKAAAKYEESVKKDDPWEVQYQHMINFVSKYEAMAKKVKPLIDTNNPEFKALYDLLSPKAGAAKISLEHFVDVARGNELSEYKNQPWARESTLKKIEQTLKGGIQVKDSGGDGKDDTPQPTSPSAPLKSEEKNKNEVPNTKKPPVEKLAAEAVQTVKDAVRESVKPVLTAFERQIIEVVEEAKGKALRKWENTDRGSQERLIDESLRSKFTMSPAMSDDDADEVLYEIVDFSRGVSELSDVVETLKPWVISTKEDNKTSTQLKTEKTKIAIADGATSLNNIQEEIVAHQQNTEAIREETTATEKLNEVKNQNVDVDDDAETIAKENGQLEDKLELLRDIAEEYGKDISQKQRNSYERLNQKEMDSGLTPKEDDRYYELGEQIAEADDALEEFGQTYDKIILKLANGKKVEILPDDKGLRSLYKFSDEYGETYNGVEIDDVVYQRVEKEVAAHQDNTAAIVAETQATEQLNTEKIEAQQIGAADKTHKTSALPEITATVGEVPVDTSGEQTQLTNLKGSVESVTTAINAKTEAFKAEGIEVGKTVDGEIAKIGELENKISAVKTTLEGLLSNVKTGSDDVGAGLGNITVNVNHQENEEKEQTVSIDRESLRQTLGEVTYNVKIIYDDNDKQANKVAIDEGALEATLRRVFTDKPGADDIASVQGANAKVQTDGLVAQYKRAMATITEWQTLYQNLNNLPSANKTAEQRKNILNAMQGVTPELAHMIGGAFEEAFKIGFKGFKSADIARYVGRIAEVSLFGSVPEQVEMLRGVDANNFDFDKLPIQKASIDALNPVFELLHQIDAINKGVGVDRLDGESAEQPKESYALDSTLKEVKSVLDQIQKNTASLNGAEIQRAVEANTNAIEQVAPAVASEINGHSATATKQTLDKVTEKLVPGIPVPARRTEQSSKRTDTAYQTQRLHYVPEKGPDGKLTGELELGLVEIVNDFDKLRKETKKSAEAVVRAQKKVNEFVAKFESKTGGNAKFVDGFSDLQSFTVNENNIDEAYNKMIELQRNYAQLETNFRKGQSSLNPFVNAINKSQNIGNIFGDVEDKFNGLVVKSDELTSNFNKLRELSEQIKAFTEKVEIDPDSITPADFTEFSKQMGEFTSLKTQVDSMIRSEAGKNKEVRTYNAQVEAEIVKELIGLYGQLGRAQATGDLDETSRLRGIISEERGKLTSVDYATDMKFKDAKSKGFEVERTQAENDARREQETILQRLNKLYQEYGILVERAAFAEGNLKEELEDEIKNKSAEIMTLRKSMDVITPEMFKEFDEAQDRGRNIEATKQYRAFAKKSDANEVTKLRNIARLEKEIGELRADADAQRNDGVKNAIEEEIHLREQLIEMQRQGLEMEEADEAYYRRSAKNRTEQARADATQAIKDRKDAFKEAEKEAKKQVAEDKRQAKRNAMFGKAGSAIGRAENLWMGAQGEDEPLPPNLISRVDRLYEKMVALRAEQDKVRTSETITEEQQEDLRKHTIEVNALTNEVSELFAEYQKLSGKNVEVIGTNALGADASLDAYNRQLKQAVLAKYPNAQIKSFDAATKTLTYTVKTGSHEFTEYTAAVRRAGGALVSVQGATKRTETFLEATTRKMKELTSYFSGMAIFNQIGQELRRGIQYVREIDLALTELKKVTDETEEEYDQFLQTAAKTGARLGTTISAVTEATATFAKLGYSMEQATEMAESAIVYKNVGDNIESTEDAADSIISTMKGFKLEATESMAIVDRFNEVGNRFAITSKGIGEALRLSASALSEGGNSLDESIGLITAANEVVNDPSSVGTALKTLTLRLRGAKTELEEMGEDVTDMATTTSALQAKLLALTGGQVDIMLDENTFKNSTQILREMAEAWEDMNDIQRASALELMGGKRQANVLSALIQNFDTVEKVIETSANSAGSALEENERYLDSIQGKIDQFNNSMQAMWSNTLDSGVVKWFVNLGTELIKVVDALGLIPSILLSIASFKILQSLFKGTDIIGFIKSIGALTMGTKVFEAETRKASFALMGETINAKLAGSALVEYAVKMKLAEAADISKMTTTQLLGLSFKALGVAIWSATKAVLAFLFTNPVGWVILAIGAIAGGIAIFNHFHKTTEELTEELDELKNKLQDINSELDSLNSELETTQSRMAELLAMDSLSFSEQEELDRLRKQNDELQRSIDLNEQKQKNAQKAAEKTFIQTAESIVNKDTYDYGGKRGFWDKLFGPQAQAYGQVMSADEYIDAMMAEYDKHLGYQKDQDANGYNWWTAKDPKANPEKYAGQIQDYIDQLTEAADGIDYDTADTATQDWLDYIYNLEDKWAIHQGGENAKTNAINRIFNKDENDVISESIDGYVEALRKGDESAKEHIRGIIENNAALKEDILASGLEIDNVVDHFTMSSSSTAGGIMDQYKIAITALEELKSSSFSINDLVEYDTDSGEATGKIIEIAEKLRGTGPEVREQFTSIIEEIKEGSYKTEKGLTDWDTAIRKMELHGLQAVIASAKIELEATNKLAFPDLEVSGWIDSVSELSNAFESLSGAMDLVVTAQKQMDSSGRISLKTALDLMASTDQWNEILTVNNGVITMNANAEQILIQSKLDLIQANIDMALQEVETQIALAEGAINSTKAGNAFTNGFTKALTNAQSILVGLKAGWDAFWEGTDVSDAFNNAYKQTVDTLSPDQASLDELYQQRAELEKKRDMVGSVDTTQKFKDYYDFDKTPGDKYDDEEDALDKLMDEFQRAMDYWENRIGANQARYEQLQNEIDLLESKGQKASAEYYKEQIGLLQEFNDKGVLVGGTMHLLAQKRSEAYTYLKSLKEGSEEWWEVANVINDIESEIDEVTASVVDLQDAMAETEWYKFEEFGNRLDDITSKLETIRDLIAPNGEEEWFDDQGQWTEEGVAVLGTYIQELETYKSGLAKAADELKKYKAVYSDSTKAYYANLGIHSEQEYYDKVQELTEQQYDYVQSISDTEQSVVDMYESNIDAVEEYTDKLVDSYNDYIDSVKDALDAERDLYNFKKNIKKQTKDIAAIERRIASLSGSTNASDIAERRRLEADLYGAREELDDTYYEHAKETQQEALDNEAEAYEEAMNRFIEGLRISLEQATLDMDIFLNSVTAMVSLNAGAILTEYQNTGLELSPALTAPWEAAKKAVGGYKGDALDLMNEWTRDGYWSNFTTKVGDGLSSPWNAGSSAATAFQTSAEAVMNAVRKNISSNVKTASEEISELYSQILDTEKRAQNISVGGGSGSAGNNSNNGSTGNTGSTGGTGTTHKHLDSTQIKKQTEAQKIAAKIVRFGSAQGSGMNAGKKGDNGIISWNGKEYKVQNSGVTFGKSTNLYKAAVDTLKLGNRQIFGYNGKVYGHLDGVIQEIEGRFWSKKDYNNFVSAVKSNYGSYAQGTTGTKRDEWALTDEPQFGDELVLVPGKDGNLSFMRKGTGVVPADLTEKLFELAQIPTSDLMSKNMTAIVPNITKNDFKNEVHFDSLLHVDHCDQNTLKDLEKMMDNKINDFSRQMNYSLKKFAR